MTKIMKKRNLYLSPPSAIVAYWRDVSHSTAGSANSQ